MLKFQELGGLEGIEKRLKSNIKTGLSDEYDSNNVLFGNRKEFYGKNILPKAESKHFLRLVLDALSDKTLIILMVASLTSIGIGIYEAVAAHEEEGGQLGSWVEGLAIMVAGMILSSITLFCH